MKFSLYSEGVQLHKWLDDRMDFDMIIRQIGGYGDKQCGPLENV